MLIFVGLGNPGAKYASTRHNIGWMAVERIAQDHGFGPWRSKFQGQISEGHLKSEKVMLLKPETFMNLSGQSVQAALRFYKALPAQLWVFHDELDLAPGKVRAKQGGGHAGHNGLRSIHQHIGDAYGRVRLGIGHPGQKNLVSSYVLSSFAKGDQTWLEGVLTGVSSGAPTLVESDMGGFSHEVARHRPDQPPAQAPQKTSAEPRKRAPPDTEHEPAPSPLQRLMNKFR